MKWRGVASVSTVVVVNQMLIHDAQKRLSLAACAE